MRRFKVSTVYYSISAILLLTTLGITGCAGNTPSPVTGSTVTDTTNAYIRAWEAGDSVAINDLLTNDAKQLWTIAGGPSKWLTDKSAIYGATIKDAGRVFTLNETGSTATADIGVVYDCKPKSGLGCSEVGEEYKPDWAGEGNVVSADHLTIQKQSNGKWLITFVENSSYLFEMSQATEQAVVRATETNLATEARATRTAQAESANATRDAIPTRTPIPTKTPTPRPMYSTVKVAYELGDIASRMQEWSSDAILFRAFDRYLGLYDTNQWPFDYNPSVDVIIPGIAGTYEPYVQGDGTSRQTIFFIASPSKKEVKVFRVLDGKLEREDVSASMYRDLFSISAIVPEPLDLNLYIDSDKAVQIAREHGLRVSNLDAMYVQISTEDRKSRQYKTTEPNWTVFGEQSKAVVIDPLTSKITRNDF